MIGYTMVGTKNLDRSFEFYAPLFEEMGLALCWRDERTASWGRPDDPAFPRFITGYPYDQCEASVGNGVMTAFLLDGPEKVDRLHRVAMRHGGANEGLPGFRPQYGESFYGSYIRDPDGNKIAFVHYTE